MTRRLGNLLTLLSGVLLVVVAFAWIASPWRSHVAGFFARDGALQLVAAHRHSLMFGFSNIPIDGRRWSVDATSSSPEDGQTLFDTVTQPATFKRAWLGFQLLRGPSNAFGLAGRWYTAIILPIWFVLLVASILPLRWTRRRLTNWRRKRRGACLHCGYDLRETRDRCPECGNAVTARPDPQSQPA